MNSTFEYKGYVGSAEVDSDEQILVGRLLFIRDAIAYSALDVTQLEKEFRKAVDEYLADCLASGHAPDVPCKGSFNVRVGAALHRDAALTARVMGVSLNDFVCESIRLRINFPGEQIVQNLKLNNPLAVEAMDNCRIYSPSSGATEAHKTNRTVYVLKSESFDIDPANESLYDVTSVGVAGQRLVSVSTGISCG
jgi:predicted HicB family RNase H-like nuclease